MSNAKLPADPASCASDHDPSALSIESARQRIFSALPTLNDTETVSLKQAHGRILAEPVIAQRNVPPFRSSAMDGYAFRHRDARHTLEVIGTSLAGHPAADDVPENCCVRITTGARVPDGADTVVMQENVTVQANSTSGSNSPARIVIDDIPTLGFNVRSVGSDTAAGAPLLSAGQRLDVPGSGLLAAHGLSTITARSLLRVAIFSTGDELRDVDQELAPGQIYDANRPMLAALLQDPAIELLDAGICPDRADALESMIEDCRDAQILISSGGVSVGEADHVRAVLSRSGSVDLWKIAMKPGRPLTFGFTDSKQAYFGLPGNPVSAVMTFLLFVRPALQHMLGVPYAEPRRFKATLDGPVRKLPGRVEFQRGWLQSGTDQSLTVSTTGMQDSHRVSSLHQANCLIELPLHSSGADAGADVLVIPFTEFGNQIL